MADPVTLPVGDYEKIGLIAYLTATLWLFIRRTIMTTAEHDRQLAKKDEEIVQLRKDHAERLAAERERRIEAVELASRLSVAARETAVTAREVVTTAVKAGTQ